MSLRSKLSKMLKRPSTAPASYSTGSASGWMTENGECRVLPFPIRERPYRLMSPPTTSAHPVSDVNPDCAEEGTAILHFVR